MSNRLRAAEIAFLATGLLFAAAAFAQQTGQRDDVVRALLEHRRLLAEAHFEIPIDVYRRYLRELHAPDKGPDAPVPYVAESATYHLTVGADFQASLKAELRLRVFDPIRSWNLPVLSAKFAWEDLAVNDKPAKLATGGDWLRFSPVEAGVQTITAQVRLDKVKSTGGTIGLDVAGTVRTAVAFDSPGAWEVQAGGESGRRLIGTAEKGTHGRLALTPRDKLQVKYHRPRPKRARPPRYALQGEVAWNLGAAAQQVTASLKATIAAGASDRIVLLLPDGADRVSVTGPEVRQVQVTAGRATVYLRGKILGQTVLKVSYELPAGRGAERRFGRLGVADGRWAGGTLVITNSAGGSEVIPAAMAGLREMALAEIPPEASAILPAPAVLAYQITSREFSVAVEVLRLGEFALRQSIADLAHYEVFLARDGLIICRARYEIRNRNRQFLRLDLPAGARVLLARVNEKSRPISPAPGKKNEWLLPLERSSASVMGLVSFPVEVVFLCRTAPPNAKGVVEIPLPAIDLPVAYGWCETYVPAGLEVEKWSGVMKKVSRFTSETATASLDYGWGELAAGYTEKDRPTVRPTPKPAPPTKRPSPRIAPMLAPATQPTSATSLEREMGVPILSKIPVLDRAFTNRAKVRDEETIGFIQLPEITTQTATPILAKNYYRAGKDFYDKGDYANAAEYLEQVARLAPGSAEARNARRLLANPQMPKALKLKTKAEKAAAKVIERELEESNILLVSGQVAYIKMGQAAAREGRYKEAAVQFKAAKSATEQLIARGAAPGETRERLRKAQPEMKQLREQTTAEVGKLRKRMGEFKKAGEYDEALKVAEQLRRRTSTIADPITGARAGSFVVYASQPTQPGRRGREELQKEIESLAAAASRQRQEQAGAEAERLSKEREQKVEILTRGTRALIAEDRFGESLELLSQIQKMDPGNKWASEQAEAVAQSLLVQRQKQQVAAQRREIESRRSRRELVMDRRKSEKIAMMKAQVRTLRDEQKYRQAIEVCDEIRRLDPDDAWANEWYTQLSRFVALLDAKESAKTGLREEVKELHDVRAWGSPLRYPRDWPGITLKRKGVGAGRIAGDRPVSRRLQQRLPELKFEGIKFEDVVQFLRDVSNCNIHVKWGALEAVGIKKASPVNVFLTDVTFEKGLRTILDDVGGVTPLGYVVDEGVITISTKDDLSAQTVTRVYDVSGLAGRLPQFKGPKIDAGRMGNNAGGVWGNEEGTDDDENMVTRRDAVTNLSDMIRSTVAPDTWRENAGMTGSVRRLGGKIVVTQSAENQKAVADLIRQLRRGSGGGGGGRGPFERYEGFTQQGPADVAAESEADRAARRRLKQTLPRLMFDGIAFGDVVQFLREVSGCSIHVRWAALEAVGIDKTSPVSINLTDVTLKKALRIILEDVGGVNPLGFRVDEGVITISTMDDLSTQTVTRVFDIRDLVISVPKFKGPKVDVRELANADNNAGGIWAGDDWADDDDNVISRQKVIANLLELFRSTVAPETWRENSGTTGSVRELGGQIVVVQTPENQRALMDLLTQLRQASGPQVEEGEKIAQQKAGGKFLDDIQVDFVKKATRTGAPPRLTIYNGQAVRVVDEDGGWRWRTDGKEVRIKDKELDEFIQRNYDWALKGYKGRFPTTVAVNGGTVLLGGQKANVPGLLAKLQSNLGQKVTVNSLNVNADARAAAALGVRFVRGNNDVNWSVINEAQFRSLMELDAAAARHGRVVAADGRLQETIVGTDAYLANAMTANVTFAGDKGNTLDVNGNSVNLSHEGYVLIDNGSFLTVVQAGPMQHWRERPVLVQFVEVPQNIEVPRVGQLFRFERTLLKPSDKMVLRAVCKWKGEQR